MPWLEAWLEAWLEVAVDRTSEHLAIAARYAEPVICYNIAAGKELAMKLVVTLDRDETGMIVAECPAIPGCISQGKTEEEAIENIKEAIRGCVEARLANGMPLAVATGR